MKRDPFTSVEAWEYFSASMIRLPKLEIHRTFYELLTAGQPFHGDQITRNGELTVTADTTIDNTQSRLSGVTTRAMAQGFITDPEETTSNQERRRRSIAHMWTVTARGRAAGPLLLDAIDRYERSLLED